MDHQPAALHRTRNGTAAVESTASKSVTPLERFATGLASRLSTLSPTRHQLLVVTPAFHASADRQRTTVPVTQRDGRHPAA
jgi:hypothetical protein